MKKIITITLHSAFLISLILLLTFIFRMHRSLEDSALLDSSNLSFDLFEKKVLFQTDSLIKEVDLNAKYLTKDSLIFAQNQVHKKNMHQAIDLLDELINKVQHVDNQYFNALKDSVFAFNGFAQILSDSLMRSNKNYFGNIDSSFIQSIFSLHYLSPKQEVLRKKVLLNELYRTKFGLVNAYNRVTREYLIYSCIPDWFALADFGEQGVKVGQKAKAKISFYEGEDNCYYERKASFFNGKPVSKDNFFVCKKAGIQALNYQATIRPKARSFDEITLNHTAYVYVEN